MRARRGAEAGADHDRAADGTGHGFMTADVPLTADGTFGFVPAAATTAEERLIAELEARLRADAG